MKSSFCAVKKTALAVVLSAAALGSPVNSESLDIGVLLPSPIADVGWSHALVEGFNGVKEKYVIMLL